MLFGFIFRHTRHRDNSVLEGDGIVFALLGVDVQNARRPYLEHGTVVFARHDVALLVANDVTNVACQRIAKLPAQRCSLQLTHESRLAVARLAADDVQLADISERHPVALHRVSWRSVWFVEVEKIIIDFRLKPVVTM